MEPGGGRGVKLVGLREAMSSEQALWCLEGLAVSVQRGSEAVGCLEHRGFSRGCLGCRAPEVSGFSGQAVGIP